MKSKRVYIAGPLFNEMERSRNLEMKKLVESAGHSAFLPQEDGMLSYTEIAEGKDVAAIRRRIFELDTEEIRNCDAILCLLDGRVPDEGMCFELGMAYVLGKTCVAYRTDARTLDAYGVSLILDESFSAVAETMEELREMLANL